MAVQHMTVGVVATRRKLNNPWVDFEWTPEAILPGLPAVDPGTVIARDGPHESHYLGPAELTFHSGETAHYRDNLTSGRPSVWVALRDNGDGVWRVAGVTVDPYEGEAYADVVGDRVEPVPMPHDVMVELAAFFEAHHVEQTFFKRKRDRHVQEPTYGLGHPALARRPPGAKS